MDDRRGDQCDERQQAGHGPEPAPTGFEEHVFELVGRQQPEHPGRAEHDQESDAGRRRTTRAGGAGTAPRRPGRAPCAARACVAPFDVAAGFGVDDRAVIAVAGGTRRDGRRCRRRRTELFAGTLSVRPQPLHRNAAASEATSIGCFVPQSGHCRTGAISSDQSRVVRAASVLDAHERVERAGGAPAVDRMRRPPRPRHRSPAAMPATTSAAAAFSTAMSRCGPFSPARTARIACAFVAASPPARCGRIGAGDAEVERVERERAQLAVDELVHRARRGGGELVEPVVAVEHHRPLGAELAQRAEHLRRHRLVARRRRPGAGRAPGSRAVRGS